jgi:hypothetical protein
VANSAVAVAEKDGGSYFDFKIPEDGAATRFDAFTQWGKDTPGFAPESLQPAPVLDGVQMHVGLNPKNFYSPTFDDSYVNKYSLTYDSSSVNSAKRPSKPPPVSGSGPRRGNRT